MNRIKSLPDRFFSGIWFPCWQRAPKVVIKIDAFFRSCEVTWYSQQETAFTRIPIKMRTTITPIHTVHESGLKISKWKICFFSKWRRKNTDLQNEWNINQFYEKHFAWQTHVNGVIGDIIVRYGSRVSESIEKLVIKSMVPLWKPSIVLP